MSKGIKVTGYLPNLRIQILVSGPVDDKRPWVRSLPEIFADESLAKGITGGSRYQDCSRSMSNHGFT
jgi:hypothetical protein